MRFLIALFLLLPSLVSCSSSNYLIDKPLILSPQNVTQSGGDMRERSMKALLAAFSDYKWEIRKIDKEQGIVVAEACRRGEHCAEVQATVREDGTIEIIRTPGQDLSEDEGGLLKRWLERLRKGYEKHLREPLRA